MSFVEQTKKDTSSLRQRSNTSFFVYYAMADWVILLIAFLIGYQVPDLLFDTSETLTQPEFGSAYNLTFVNMNNSNDTQYLNIYLMDPMFNREYTIDSAVTGVELGIYSAFLPLGMCLAFLLFLLLRLDWYPYLIFHEAIALSECLGMGIGLTHWTTKSLKIIVCWPRPDQWSRSLLRYEQVIDTDEWEKGWKSFPSGHTSYMFLAAFLVFWWFKSKLNHCDFLFIRALKLNIFKYTIVIDCWMFVQCLNCWVIVAALIISISRIDDRRHFVTDILTGCFLSFANALISYQCFFSFRDPFSHRVNRMLKNGEIIQKKGEI